MANYYPANKVFTPASLTVNLGPVSPAMRDMTPSSSRLAYNPRCLRRDLSSWLFTREFIFSSLANITIGPASGSIGDFQNEFQGRFGDGFLGLHTTGHTGTGGDASDLFSSPNDPTFFMHHSMLDRVYWIWQALHPSQRFDIAGTITINNTPPSRDAVTSDPLEMGPVATDSTIGAMLDTMGGTPLCYIYL